MPPIKFDQAPTISVVLATYNRANYLPKAIQSILEQTFQDWELIIVDDGSQDNTFEIVNSYLEDFNNIRYLKQQNKKQYYAKNAGIQASFGKYITFLDSDDYYLPHHLESRLCYLTNNPGVDLIQGGIGIDGEMMLADYYNPGQLIDARKCVFGATFFGKRNVFFELGGFNAVAYGEDTDFWQRAEKAMVTQKITEPATYVYTRAETSITKSAV